MKRDTSKRPASATKTNAQGEDSPEVPSPEASPNATPFDVPTVKSLVELMTQHDLSEIDLRDGRQRLRLRRGAKTAVVAAGPLTAAPVVAPAAAPPAPAAPEAAPPAAPAKKLIDIKSQTVGTFYTAPTPGAEPFVKVGSKVNNNTVIGLIEAMKLFNEVTAECSGVIVEILVENQQPVEFGQVLMRVDPNP
ncbi:MAG: acetyl-CoA carboxylase biotin carboxyl carrier protein [Gemmataceae bacterium]|nr:acetyl-CoA carboxylase biotin carboxyl carrier protein [Gemmataceae bacterium]